MKKAFTMIELVFVIVVIGILAAVIIPNTRTNPVQEAAIKLLSQIKYTQHLAMVDDGYNSTTTWYRNRWQIVMDTNGSYSIISNGVYAKDPQISSKNIQNIELKGVTVALTDGCNGETMVSFDHLGRPMLGSLTATTTPYPAAGNGRLLDANCTITLTNGSESSVITLVPETGYSKIN